MNWKYKVISLGDRAQANSQKLNEAGSVGWELVAVYGNGTGLFAYLKQQNVDPSRVYAKI